MIGSVKTNIGHLEAAAGVAGLIKTVLVAAARADSAASAFPLHESPYRLGQPGGGDSGHKDVPWPRGERVRRAAVSSFGFSGTNAHVIVEEAPLPAPRQAEWQRGLAYSGAVGAHAGGSGRTDGTIPAGTGGDARAELGDICFHRQCGKRRIFEERSFYSGQDRRGRYWQRCGSRRRGRKDGVTPS